MIALRFLPWFLAGSTLALLAACQTPSGGDSQVSAKEKGAYERVETIIAQESEEFTRHQESQKKLEKKTAPLPLIKPVAPSYDPLADMHISLSLDNMEVRQVLRLLAEEVGVNLTISPDAIRDERTISLNFKDAPASEVLSHVLRQADLYGEIKGNLLTVDLLQEKIFHLDFLETTSTSSFNVGGDVLGSSGTSGGSSSGLTGNFKIEGAGAKESNPYEILENMLNDLKGSNGKFVLNRLSGTLYVQDRPSVVANIEKMVERFGTMMRRQILLEARILEVVLNDAHQFGVDWTLFRYGIDGTRAGVMGTSNSAMGSVGAFAKAQTQNLNTYAATTANDLGNVPMQAIAFNSGWSAVLTMLQEFGDTKLLSNPSIRMRHGQPAMISVGLNNTYTSKITTTPGTTTNGTTSPSTTNVETGNVFDGLLLGVIPFIADDGRISLTIHPIQSKVVEGTLTPVAYGETTKVASPRVNLREISTSIEVRDGDTVVLGGLISKNKSENKRGLPGVADIPFFGGLLGGFQSESMEVSELVIVLRISVL